MNVNQGASRSRRKRTFVHLEDRSKRFFGVVQGAVPVIKDTDTVPQLGILLSVDMRTEEEMGI